MNKKGVVLQFHWIFILVAGGIILAFFFSIASKQTVLSDDKLSLSLVQSLDVVFEMAESSESTSQIIPLPKKGLSFICSADCDCYIQTGKARQSFAANIIFSEKEIESAEVVVWSLPWEVPFKATNILYVVNPETRFIVVYDNTNDFSKQVKQKVEKIIPENIFLEFLTVDEFRSVSYDGSKLTKIFFISENKFIPPALDDADLNFVEVGSNMITFYEITEYDNFISKGSMRYPNDVVWVLAALFSEDYDMFVCGIKSALKRLNLVADVFFRRSVILADKTKEGFSCLYPEEAIKSLITDKIDELNDVELWNKINIINEKKEVLKISNNQLIQHSCPELY